MFDGKRKFNSGFVSRDKAREILQAVFRDNPSGIYQKKPGLFLGLELSQFINLVNGGDFLNSSILNFVNVY